MRLAALLCLLACAAPLAGCTATYTDIRKVDEQTYLLTRTKNGFFRTYGTLFRCQTRGDSLYCIEIDSP